MIHAVIILKSRPHNPVSIFQSHKSRELDELYCLRVGLHIELALPRASSTKRGLYRCCCFVSFDRIRISSHRITPRVVHCQLHTDPSIASHFVGSDGSIDRSISPPLAVLSPVVPRGHCLMGRRRLITLADWWHRATPGCGASAAAAAAAAATEWAPDDQIDRLWSSGCSLWSVYRAPYWKSMRKSKRWLHWSTYRTTHRWKRLPITWRYTLQWILSCLARSKLDSFVPAIWYRMQWGSWTWRISSVRCE